MRHILLLILSTSVALAVPGASAARPPVRAPGSIGWISWAPGSTLLFDDSSGLHSIRADGSRLQRMSARGADGRWSPDRRAIAVNYQGEGIAVIRLGGRGVMRLTRTGLSPVWSPSGARLAYSDFNVRVIRADGSHDHLAVPLRFGQNEERENDWSPDGTQLVFSACLRGVPDGDLCPDAVYTAELARPRFKHRLSLGRGTCPEWGAAGAIAYRVRRSIAIAWPGRRPRIAARRAFSCPEWSPDGRLLAVEAARSLLLVSLDGSTRRHIGSLPRLPGPFVGCLANAPAPVWSADGHFLAVDRLVEGRGEKCAERIYVVRVRDGRTQLIVRTAFRG